MSEITLNMIRNLQTENAEIRRELRELSIERNEWKEKAVGMMHELTYACERANRKGLVAIKCPVET